MSKLVDAAALAFRFGIGFVFLQAAVPKLLARPAFERAVRNYALLPSSVVRPVAAWLPRIELICAIALLIGVAVPEVAMAGAFLLAIFASAVALSLARGREIDCGCQGSIVPRQISWSLVASDLALAGLALFVAITNPDVLTLDVPASAASTSLTTQDGFALLLLAGTLVVGQLLVSNWLNLRSTIKEVSST
jgi:uncharacterized membrane protein YphA (DoxX/SURF4 family)